MRTITDWDAAPSESIVVAALDVTSDASVEALVARVMEAEGRIDIVVNNAGYGLAACLEMATIAEAKALFDTNVWG
jgi:NAD(P)-dependent dehydrogenase (short-subunit alcohol dehydrogenase family)